VSHQTFRYLILLTALLSSGCSSINLYDTSNTGLQLALASQANSVFKRINASFTVARSPQQLFSFLSNHANTPLWLEYAEQPQQLSVISLNEVLVSTRMRGPALISPRLVVSCIESTSEKGQIAIRARDCSHRLKERKEWQQLAQGSVAVNKLSASWTLTPIDSTSSHDEYQLWLEPGGQLPALLYNNLLLDSSKRSLTKLIELLNQQPK